ncbi:MAG: sporulation protein, partial [Streptomyces sp.]|nr:sporulation protein [Streptomyces sp.]
MRNERDTRTLEAVRARRGPRTRVALAVASTIALTVPAPAQAAAHSVTAPAQVHWTTRTVAPGVQMRTGTIQHPDAEPTWTV